MGIIGRSFVVAGLALGTLVAGLVVGTEGSETEKGTAAGNALQIAVTKDAPAVLEGKANTSHVAAR